MMDALDPHFAPESHPLAEQVGREVNDYFLTHWHFPDAKSRKKFIGAGFPRVTCLYFPMALDDRIHFACRLLTLLFLVDDLLENISLQEGQDYNERLMGIIRCEITPNRSIPAEYITHDLWESMRCHDLQMTNDIVEPVFVFMRAQTDSSRLKPMDLGSYLVYREKDVGRALLDSLMRFCMGLAVPSTELDIASPIAMICSKHLSIVNDIWSYEKELKTSQEADQEGGVLCTAVAIVARDTGLSISATKRVLYSMCREWESQFKELEEAIMTQNGTETLRIYLHGLRYQMGGNEIWSKTTARYNEQPKENHTNGQLNDRLINGKTNGEAISQAKSPIAEESTRHHNGHVRDETSRQNNGHMTTNHSHAKNGEHKLTLNNDPAAQVVQITDSIEDKAEPELVRLNAMDNVMPRFYANFIFAFGLKSNQNLASIHDVLQTSLERTCVAFPALGYKVFTIPEVDNDSRTGRLEARKCEAWKPKLVFNDLSKTWPAYDDLLDAGLGQDFMSGEQILPKSEFDFDLTESGAPAVVCQANYVDSGLLLAVGIFHSVIDGMSGSLFMKMWAQSARRLGGLDDSGSVLMIHPDSNDYSLMERIWLHEKNQSSLNLSEHTLHKRWRLLGLLPPSTPVPAKTPAEVVNAKMDSKLFYVSADSIENLSSKCLSRSGSTKITGNDVLMALLWRCTIRARAVVCGSSDEAYFPDALTCLDTTLDGRALIGDPLPWSYMGTLILVATTSMTVGHLTSDSTDIADIAIRMRESINSITRDHILEGYGLAAELPSYDNLPRPFATLQGAEVCITSWITLSAFDISFGEFFTNGGRPDRVRVPRLEFGALCRRIVVLPRQGTGGLEVLIEMKQEELEVLESDAEFRKYAKAV